MRKAKIKVTYIVDFFRTVNAGTEGQLGQLSAKLTDGGYSVQLISFQDSTFLQKEAPQLFPKVDITTLRAQSDISKSLSALVRLYHILRKSKPDIAHTFFPSSNIFGVIIARLTGVRRVISSRRDMGYNLTKKDIVLLRIANHFVSFVIVNAKAVQEHTIKVEGIKRDKTRVIYNGISCDDYKHSSHKNIDRDPVIGIVANLNRPVKRVDLFIKAAAIIHRNFPNVKFWIFGDGPLRKDLEILASNLNLNLSLSFMGHRPREFVIQSLQEMTVGVICSGSDGLSNTILEYMASGLPVVATDVGENSELIDDGKTGFLVSPGDSKALAAALTHCLKQSELALTTTGLAASEWIRSTFSIEKMLDKTRHLYSEVVSCYK
jgi:L-malate glycosyltransferase